MKMPEPVAWIDSSDLELMHKYGRGCIAWGNEQNNAKTPLFTEVQLRELLSKQEAVMHQALEVIELHPYPGWDHVWETKQALKRELNLEE